MAREERPQTSPIPARGLPTGTTPESAVDDDRTGEPGFAPARSSLSRMRVRPVSPNIQIYRPQLTSVLSIANRITGIALSVAAIGLVIWLTAAASGASAYGAVQNVLVSWVGQVFLFIFTFAFFLHLCGGIRHLIALLPLALWFAASIIAHVDSNYCRSHTLEVWG